MRGLIIILALFGPAALSYVFWLTFQFGSARVTIRKQEAALTFARAGLTQIRNYAFTDEYSKNLAIVTLYDMEETLRLDKKEIN